MPDSRTLIEQAYSAFNKRDIDGALALMTQDVSWSKASEGGRVVGKEEIRAYWVRQWGEYDPHVEPLAMTVEAGGKVRRECAPNRQEPSSRCSFGHRGSSRVYCGQRSHRTHAPRESGRAER